MKFDFECAVIGGGPGGLVSSLYLARFKRSVVMINAGKPRVAWIPKTRNLSGYPKGISGQNLLRRMHRQISKYPIELWPAEVQVTKKDDGFIVASAQAQIRVPKVILATGIEDIQPNVQNLDTLRTRGFLRYCPVCDAYDYRNQRLTVLAQDDDGLQRALFLRRFTAHLRVVIPPDLNLGPQRIRSLKLAQVKVSQGILSGIEIARGRKGVWITLPDQRPIFSDAIYVELGSRVREFSFSKLKKLRRTKDGFLITTQEQRTSIPGLYAVGDCVNLLGQISVAAGQAAVATTTIHDELREI